MNLEKWEVLLQSQLVKGMYHPALGQRYLEKFFEYAPSIKRPKLLRIGDGEGRVEKEGFIKHGYVDTTITIQPWQHGIQMDMHDLMFPPETFDCIYATQTFEHAYAPWLLLLECWVVLRFGGILYFVVPTPDLHNVFTHPNMLFEEQWIRSLEQCGFNIIDHYTENYDVSCICEDDHGTPFGYISHHETSCITLIAEKVIPEGEQVRETLNRLVELHENSSCSPVK